MGIYKKFNLIFNEEILEVDNNVSVDKIAQILEVKIIKTSSFNKNESEELKEYGIVYKFYNLDDDSINFLVDDYKKIKDRRRRSQRIKRSVERSIKNNEKINKLEIISSENNIIK